MGEGWVGVSPGQCIRNRRVHTMRIAKHVRIPEPKHPVTLSFNQLGPRKVGIIAVLPAVALDDEPGTVTRKIDDEAPQRDLSAKARVRKAFAKQSPHGLLGASGIISERSGALG